jgi:cell wall-associated NlpC family hydrolase
LYREAGHDVGEIPLGPPGHARSCATSIMTPWLDSSPHFKTVKLGEGFEAGDLLGFNLLGTLHHLAILLPRDQIVHSIYGVGVSITPRLDSTWHSRHAATWRPIAASK